MGEQVAAAASKLVPLLILLAVIFGVLIITAIVLRVRLRRKDGRAPKKRRSSRIQMQSGDVVTVLGRTFHVLQAENLPGASGEDQWCRLEGETTLGRLRLAARSEQAIFYPGHEDLYSDQDFPEAIEREGRTYQRDDEPVSLGHDLELALYTGTDERRLAIEKENQSTTLWRGKTIPAEGVEILEEN